jgi:hypothetical protein
MLYPPTCVGFGTGAGGARLRGFSGGHGIGAFAHSRFVSRLGRMGGGLPCPPARALSRGRPEPRAPALPRHRSRLVTRRRRYGNVRPSRIGIASRLILSTRLTLGGLASPRKPWAFGVRVSRSHLATHASILAPRRSTRGRPARFAPAGDAPLPQRECPAARRFGAVLSPADCRRGPTRPVSCYALFECMAASKPTSWLSGRAHILCHSARTWGPWRAVWAVPLSKAQLSPRLLTPGLLRPRHSEFGRRRQAVKPPRPSSALPPRSNGRG